MPTAKTQFVERLANDELAVRLRERFGRDEPPVASIVIPVNAQGDLENILDVFSDLAQYAGTNPLELVVIINNYDPESPPAEIERFRDWGVQVVAVPSVWRRGEAIGFSARIPGIRAARSNPCVLFDADVRIPDATAVIDWYVDAFDRGAKAAYTHVSHYGVAPGLSLKTSFALHHAARWTKRNVLRIPTTRGSNYAVHREIMLSLYDDRLLADEMNVGPTFKRTGHAVSYSGAPELYVFTSGRMFRPGWIRLVSYFWFRLRYNLRTLPVRPNVAQYTGRDEHPMRRYVDNKPV